MFLLRLLEDCPELTLQDLNCLLKFSLMMASEWVQNGDLSYGADIAYLIYREALETL